MREYLKFYIDGTWVDPVRPNTLEVDNPTTEQVSGVIAIGSAADVDVRWCHRSDDASAEQRLVDERPVLIGQCPLVTEHVPQLLADVRRHR